MEEIAQICIVGFAAATFFLLKEQLPKANARRWWFYACSLGFTVLILKGLAASAGLARLAPFLLLAALLCGGAQVYVVVRGVAGLGSQRPGWKYILLASGGALLLGIALIVALLASAAEPRMTLTVALQPLLPLICAILASHVWTRRVRCTKHNRGLSAVLLGGFVTGVLATVLPLDSAAWDVIGQCGAALAMTYLAFRECPTRGAELTDASERMESLVEAAACGICVVDAQGRLTAANMAAVAMLGTGAQNLTGRPIQELVETSSAPSPAQTQASIRRHDGSSISVECSSAPMVCDGILEGAVWTLQEAGNGESKDRFLMRRSQLLEMIAGSTAVEEVLALLASTVEEQLPGICCSVLVCEGDRLHVAAAPSLPNALLAALDGLPLMVGEIERGNVAGIQKACEETLRALACMHNLGGTWTGPMLSASNELLGMIALHQRVMEPLSSAQRQVFDEAAELAALAIEHRRSFERLLHQGHHDALTGLPNRLLLADRLQHALARAERTSTQLALLCIDLDRFKNVNDTLGHEVGDLFLQQISVRFAARVRSSDTLARTGGDEFTAVLTDIHDVHDVERVAESLINSLREAFHIDGHTLYGGASIGLALYPMHGKDSETLQRNADLAMYQAKSQGSNIIQCYSSDDAEGCDKSDIALHIQTGLEDGNFILCYQPQFTCDRRLAGFEALLRFHHPQLGILPPNRFISLAEDSGLIVPIGEWVLHTACRQIAEWQDELPIRIAVNVSPVQFATPNFADTVVCALQAANVSPELLELELTEGVLMKSVRESARQMDELAEIGVRIAADDFGTGYSSLSYLHQLPIHVLKIDRSFVAKMLEPIGTRSIVEAIISLAHRLGLQTIAEGVEYGDQLAILRAAGCDLIQGFLFSNPLSAADASKLVREESLMRPTTPGERREFKSNAYLRAESTAPGYPRVRATGPTAEPRLRRGRLKFRR